MRLQVCGCRCHGETAIIKRSLGEVLEEILVMCDVLQKAQIDWMSMDVAPDLHLVQHIERLQGAERTSRAGGAH